MKSPEVFLQELGLSSKEVRVYLALLKRGPSSVRQLAEASQINRGTTYDIIKALQDQGLVSFYEQEKKSYFVAEDPQAFAQVLKDRKNNLDQLGTQFSDVLPQLRSIAQQADKTKPVVRYYQGHKGIARILEEVLSDTRELQKSEYLVYSSSLIAEHLYKAFPDFTKQRVKAKIFVRVIALGNGKSKPDDLSERRWLNKEQSASTYAIIYGNKTAFISLDDQRQPRGVIIEDTSLAQTQILLFYALWATIK